MMTMKTMKTTCAAFALSLAVSPAAMAEGELALYNWGEYINPEIVEQFSKEFDVDVSLDTYSTNEEMLAKLQAGATGYDLIWPSVHMHDIMQKLELLEKTNVNQLAGFKNIDKGAIRSKEDPNAEYCLPYAWGAVGIVYNKELLPNLTSWKGFFEYAAAHPGKVTMLDDLRETIGVGLIMNGNSVNSRNADELAAAEALILANKPNIGAFRYDVLPLVTSGDMAASHWYVGAVLNVLQSPDKLGFIIPEEGATMYQEDICMLKSAPNKENATKFLEFMMRPDVSAKNTERLTNGSVNTAAIPLLPEDLSAHPAINPSADVRAKLQIFDDLGKDLKKYNRAWNRIKTN